MSQKPVYLNEVNVFSDSLTVKNTRVGDEAGKMKINPVIAQSLPDFGDNTIFNYIRLMPGIYALKDNSNHISIRGSQPGQNLVTFDGFKLYKTWHFLDHIGIVNPMLVRNIEIDKSGFDACFGNRTGNLVNITGIEGNRIKPSYAININSTTLNIVTEQPITKKSTLVLGYRQTFYNYFKEQPKDVTPFDSISVGNLNGDGIEDEYKILQGNIVPNYGFYDFNVKYSGVTNTNASYYVSIFYSNDLFKINSRNSEQEYIYLNNSSNSSDNYGGAVYFGQTLGNGLRINTTLSLSGSYNKHSNSSVIAFQYSDNLNTYYTNYPTSGFTNLETSNSINEVSLEVNSSYSLSPVNTIQIGTHFTSGITSYKNGTLDKILLTDDSETFFSSVYIQDLIEVTKKLKITAGIRGNFYLRANKQSLEPRLAISYNINNKWKITARTGLYQQNVIKESRNNITNSIESYWKYAVGDEDKNYTSLQNVIGLVYSNKTFETSLEFFHKNDKNHLSRYFMDYFDVKHKGLDFFLKKEIKNLTSWLSYTYANQKKEYQNQSSDFTLTNNRHELKLACIYDTKRFSFSADYIFGERKFKDPFLIDNKLISNSFNRFDMSGTYRYTAGSVLGEAGVSVLNLLDTNNNVFNNIITNSNESSNYINYKYRVLPFTVGLFLKIRF